MPQIIVAADRGAVFGQGAVTLREGVTVADFQSEHFANQLVERLGWAVEDADQLERVPGVAERDAEPMASGAERDAETMAGAAEHVTEEPEPVRDEREHERAEVREPVTAR